MEKAGKENRNNCGSVPLFPTLCLHRFAACMVVRFTMFGIRGLKVWDLDHAGDIHEP